MARVVMFVLNDVRWDSRVLREAGTLATAGHEVTVIGRPTDSAAVVGKRERRDGFAVLLVPIPGRFRRGLLAVGGGRGTSGSATIGRMTERPSKRSRAARVVVRALRAAARSPVIRSLTGGLALLIRWRLGTVAWGEAAAAAAPPADIWHAHDLSGLPAARAARRQHGGDLVYDAHEVFLEAGDNANRPAWARAALRRFEARAIREAAAVITVNAGVAVELRRIATPRRLIVVHNAPPAPSKPSAEAGMQADRQLESRPNLLREALGLPADTPVVLYHGGFTPDRGLPELIAAMRTAGLESAHLTLMGSGSLRADLLRRSAEPGVTGRVHLLPPVPPDALLAWVASADVGAMPNQPRTVNERLSTPNKLFECLAAGTPVVSSDFPERRRIVVEDPDGPLGALCDPTDADSIGAALRSILDLAPAASADLRARCLLAARERWNWEHESAGLLALYADLARDATGPNGRPPNSEARLRATFVLPSSGKFDARTHRMAIGLAERGHDILVIARAAPGLPDHEELEAGVVLRRVTAGDDPRPTGAGVRGPFRLIHEAIRIGRTAARTRVQTQAARRVDRPASIYHAMGFLALPVAIELARRAGAPFVYDARDLYAESNNIARLPAPLRAAFARRERSWARRAAAVLTVNGSLADELERRLGIPRPAVVLNAQVAWTPPEPRPDRLRAALSLVPGTPVILYHGGFMRDRGLPELIAAMRTPGLETAHLVLMGSGTLEPELVVLAAAPETAGRVHLLPPVSPGELLAWVASADVGVMPNQPRTINERLSTPNKLFECLAAGTPVVSSDFPERRRIIADDPDGPLGTLCDPTEPASIGAAIRSILDLDRAAADDLRTRCLRATAARYDWPTQFATLLRTYEEVTGSRW